MELAKIRHLVPRLSQASILSRFRVWMWLLIFRGVEMERRGLRVVRRRVFLGRPVFQVLDELKVFFFDDLIVMLWGRYTEMLYLDFYWRKDIY